MTIDERESVYQAIAGGTDLLKWFGRVPRFHDAEILSLSLNRAGPSLLILHGWTMSDVFGADGYFLLEKRAVVTFILEEITDLQLQGFNHQNVIDDLCLKRVSAYSGRSRHSLTAEPPEIFELLMEDCYGLSGHIRARRVSVSFVPGSP
jgi:hypothetical protein